MPERVLILAGLGLAWVVVAVVAAALLSTFFRDLERRERILARELRRKEREAERVDASL